MPGYRTHATVAAICGVGVTFATAHTEGIPLFSSCLAGSLCAIGGLIPDIDSENSLSFRRCLGITAGFSSLMLVSRLRDFDLTPEAVAVIGGGCFLFYWAIIGRIIQKITVHRGMWHSLPTALIVAEVIYILSSGDHTERFLNASAIGLGVLVHLTLDELYSVIPGKNGKIKKSFGTALKIFNYNDWWGTFIALAILFIASYFAIFENNYTEKINNMGQVTQQREKILEHIQEENPEIFDQAVLQWARENEITISAASPNNPKWEELQKLPNTEKQ